MKKIILNLAFLLCATTAFADPYLNIQEVKTDKGLTAWFVQDKTVPVMALKFSLKGGSQHDPQGKEGTAALLSALFDEGAGERDSEAFQNALDSNGVRMGFSATRDAFYGSFKTTMANRSIAYELFDDALNKPHFDTEAVNRMKQALQSNLRFQLMDPGTIASRKLFETLFDKQDYARPVEGTMQTLPGITRANLVVEKNSLFCRDNLKISIVGALTEDQVKRAVDRFFGDWPSCDKPIKARQQTIEQKGQTVRVAWQGAQSVVMMVQPGLARQDKDWWAARILDFALGGGEFSSRLMEEVRVKRGLTYGVSSSLVPYDDAPLWMIQAGVDAPKTDEAVSVIKQIWQDVADHGLKDDKIQEAKDYLIGSLPLALSSTDAIANILLQLQEDNLPKTTLDNRKSEINAVTSDDIKRVAKTRLNAGYLTTVIVGPQKEKK